MLDTKQKTDRDLKITNNASEAVLPISAYNESSKSDDKPSSKLVYEQTLDALSLKEGGTTVASGAEGTVVLDRTRTDSSGHTVTVDTYNLIFGRSADLFPVDVKDAVLSFEPPYVFRPVSLTKDDAKLYHKALTFLINIRAFPTSDLAKNYVKACKGAQQNASPDGLGGDVNAFFKGTKQYKDLTIEIVTAVSTYMSTFPYVWAGSADQFGSFQDANTFYLYSQGDGSQRKSAPTLEGTLTLKRTGTQTPADPTDTSGGYTATFTDSGGTPTTMTYSGGQFVSDPDSDLPAIALRGSFTLKSLFTNDRKNDNVIIPLMGGTVNGTKVLGVTIEQKEGGDLSDQFYAFFHPKTLKGWIGLFLDLFGIIMAVEFIGKTTMALGKGIKSLIDKARGKKPEASEVEKLKDEVSDLRSEMRQNQQEILDKLDADGKVPDQDDAGDAMDDARSDVTDQLDVQQGEVLQDTMEKQGEMVEELAEIEVTDKLDEAGGKLREDIGDLEQADNPSDLKDAIDQAKSDIPEINDTVKETVEEFGERIDQQTQEEIKDAQEDVEELQEDQEEAEEASDDVDDGLGGDDDLPVDV